MARLLVNKHFTEHNDAISGFSGVEDYKFGEIIICNDNEKPSIYIKDIDNNSVAISNIKVPETDKILSIDDNKISATISMVWDSKLDTIKLLGKTKDDTNVVLSEIKIFNDEENGIGNKIDKAVERTIDVTLFTATDGNTPGDTEIGCDYLKVETISNGNVKQSYIPFLTVDKLFTIEGEDNDDKSGKIIVTKDEENNKYKISHGEVNRVSTELKSSAFGVTPFISEIGINDLGHVTSIKTGTLPSTPGINITTAPKELPEDDTKLYVSKVEKTDTMGLTVTYSELPKTDIDTTVNDTDEKTLRFISKINASGNTITSTTAEVNLEGYAKTSEFSNYYTKNIIDQKFGDILDPEGELIIPPVVITGDTTEVGKYIYDIDVNSDGALEIRTQALGLNEYVKKEDVSASDTTLKWATDKEIIKIGEKATTVTLPIKPGIKFLEEETDESTSQIIVGVVGSNYNEDGETNSLTFKTKEFNVDDALTKKDVEVSTTVPTLDWNNPVTIATIGEKLINVAMPSPVNVEVTGEDVDEINSVVTAIEGNEHGINVKKAPFAAKNYVAKDEVNTSNVELPWGTKDAEGKFNTTTIATIGEKSINVALPEKPVVGMVTGNTETDNPVVVTNIELNENNELVVNFQDALPKNYITSEDLKTYLDADSIKVVDGTDSSTENKFITSIVTGKTEDNDVELTVNYGKYNIDNDITISSETVELEWDTPSEIAKIGNKTISVKLPEKDNVETIVAEKIVTYELDKIQADDKVTISLIPTINNKEGEADTIDIDLTKYVNKEVSITVEGKADSTTGNTFIKNISADGTKITREFGVVDVTVENTEDTLRWNESVEIAKVDGKPITVKLPLQPEKGEGADGNTLYQLTGGTIGDEFKVALMSGSDGATYDTPAGSVTLNLSGYLTSGDVETYIPVKGVQVDNISVLDGNGIAKITSPTVVSDDITLEWGKSNTIAKVNNTEIKFRMPSEPEKGEGADGNTKYTISGSLTDDEYKITLNNLDNENESTSATLDLSGYLTSGDVVTYIPVKGVQVNEQNVVDSNGIANIKIEDTVVTAYDTPLEFGKTAKIAKINDTEIEVIMPAAPAQVETKVDDVQINGTTIVVKDKIANINVVDNDNTLAWNTSVEIAKVGGVSITAKLPEKPAGESGVTDTTYSLSGATTNDSFKVTLTGSDNSTGVATLDFSDIPFNETSITTGKTNTGNFVKNITFNGNKNHTVNVEYGDPDLSEYSKEGHTHAEYVNQNAFGKVTDGTTTVIADSTIDTLTIAGSGNITVSANASTDTITIGINDGSYSKEGHTHTEYAPVSHKHIASDITGGTLNIARIPTGTDANSVALGNHAHEGVYLKTTDFHDTNTTLDGHYDPLVSLTDTTLGAGNGKYISAISFDKKKHITGITETELPTTAEEAKKLTAGTVGSTTIPVYFNDGVPEVCSLNYLEDADITQTYLTNKIGNYYLTGETYKGTVTDVKTVVSNTNTGKTDVATTNAATYLNTVLTNNSNTNVVSSHNIKGSGSVTVTADVNGNITISGVEYQPIGEYLSKETYLGTISGITVGSGLTGGGSAATGATDITIKPDLSSYSSLGTIGTTSKLYAVGVDKDNKLCVNVPWIEEKYNGTVTSVAIETGSTYVALTGSSITTSGTYTFDLSEGTKSKIESGNTAYGWGNHAKKGYLTGITKDNVTEALGYTPLSAETKYSGSTFIKVTEDFAIEALTGETSNTLAIGNHTHSNYENQNAFSKVIVSGKTIEADSVTDTLELVAGDNISITTDESNDKITIAATGLSEYENQNAFSNVKVGDATIEADSVTDTLELVAGSNISITTDGNDKITIAATGLSVDGHDHDDRYYTDDEIDEMFKKFLAQNDAMVFKGTISNPNDLPTTFEIGWTYKVAKRDTYFNNNLEIGDIIIAVQDGTDITFNNTNFATYWTIVQTNIDGAVIGPITSDDEHIVIFDGADGRLIKDSGVHIGNILTTDYPAASITEDDINEWNIKPYTDENVKVINYTSGYTYLIGVTTTASTTSTAVKTNKVYADSNTLYVDGNIQVSGGTVSGATAYYQDSDERLKDFGDEIDVDFEKLKEIPKSYFTWKSDEGKVMQLGTSAQKVRELYPEIVGGDDDTTLSVDYAKLSIVALKAIDKLHEENEMLRAELDMIKKHLGL